LKGFVADAVKQHNHYRALHGAPKIKHNKELSKIAQAWADNLAKTNTFQHSTNKYKGDNLGENIANKWSSSGADYAGPDAVDQWYSEEPKYDYNEAQWNPNAGHFSQVVWNGSTEVGLGKSKTKDGGCIVVANYYPAGNIIGKFKENVSPPKK